MMESCRAMAAGRRSPGTRPVVVQVGKYYHPFSGGIENNTRQIAEALSGRCRSHVVCMRHDSGPGRAERLGGIGVVRLPRLGSLWRQALSASPNRVLERLSPDCIHFHAPNPLMAWYVAGYVARHPGVRLLVSHHADLQRPAWLARPANAGYRFLLSRADRVITYTETAFSRSPELTGLASKMAVIPHGVVVPRAIEDGAEGAPAGALRLGYLGRLERWKGVHVLVDALRGLPECTLGIAGEGGARRELERQVRDAGLDDRVVFTGALAGRAKWRFLAGIDVLVLPSLTAGESFGQVLVEAQLAGKAVIAPDLPTGVREVVDGGRAGLLVPPGDVGALRRAVRELEAPSRWRALAREGHRRALGRYTREVVIDRLLTLYGEVGVL